MCRLKSVFHFQTQNEGYFPFENKKCFRVFYILFLKDKRAFSERMGEGGGGGHDTNFLQKLI